MYFINMYLCIKENIVIVFYASFRLSKPRCHKLFSRLITHHEAYLANRVNHVDKIIAVAFHSD